MQTDDRSEEALIRDKEPEIAATSGTPLSFRVATDDVEYHQLLQRKLVEASEIATMSLGVSGLVDVVELVYALAANLGVSQAELDLLRQAKFDERGGFAERIVGCGSASRAAGNQRSADSLVGRPAGQVAHGPTPRGTAMSMSLADLLRLAARGRATYAREAPPDHAAILEVEKSTFASAAQLVEDPTIIWRFIPSWMPVVPSSD